MDQNGTILKILRKKIDLSDSDKIDIVDQIINMLPEIKKKRTYIINGILTPKASHNDEYVLEKVNINGNNYYRDKYKCVLDQDTNLVGVWKMDYNKGSISYYIFEDERRKILKEFVIGNLC